MFFAIIGFLAVFFAGELSIDKKALDWLPNKYIRYFLIIFGTILVAYDLYYYILLPDMIAKFYNYGSGIAYKGTAYMSSDELKIAQFIGETKGDASMMEMLRTAAFSCLGLFAALLAWKFLAGITSAGTEIADKTDSTPQQSRNAWAAWFRQHKK